MDLMFCYLNYIYNATPKAALYEQLAEEASEIASAAAKVARILRGESPTPVTLDEACAKLTEELTDLKVVIDVLALKADHEVYDEKLFRWFERLSEKKNAEKDGRGTKKIILLIETDG